MTITVTQIAPQVGVFEFFIFFFWMVTSNGISTIAGYLMLNPVYKYIYIKYICFALAWFYCISTIVGYLMSNPLYTYISNIYDLVWLGFYGISTIVGYLMSKSSLYIYIKYI